MRMFDIFSIADFIGSCAFACSGFLLGVRKNLDIMGIFIVSMLTANGGGALRDVLIGITPHVLVDPRGFYLVIVIMVTAIILKLHRCSSLERRAWFVICDSVGLVAFSITGAMVGLEHGLNFFGVCVLAFLTAVGGGIIRDTVVKEHASILDEGFYGSIAILVAISLYALNYYTVVYEAYILAVFTVALVIRLIAYRYHWRLPVIPKG